MNSSIREWRFKEQSSSISLPKDTVFIVEAVLDVRISENQKDFLVKFAGFPFEAACWEPVQNLPRFLSEFYKNKSNLRKTIPGPAVRCTKQVGDSEIFLDLEWSPKTSVKDTFASEELFSMNADALCSEALRSTCNTRKIRDKRDRRHTAGILISAKPCGIIPHVDELFGCESIKQVHGSIIEFLASCSSDVTEKLKLWMFDDMCHLKPHSEKNVVRNQSVIAEKFAALSKCVDKFHYPGHKKSDSYCRENCNPNIELKKLGINEINSPACEQAFKWINCYKNLKTMNESRFKFFLLYMIDIHNLHIEGSIKASNPLDKNWASDNSISARKIEKDTSEDVIGDFEKLSIASSEEVKLEDCYTEEPAGTLKCNFCPGTYKREGHMKNHVETKHNMIVALVCKCGQVFVETTRFNRHKKGCVKF